MRCAYPGKIETAQENKIERANDLVSHGTSFATSITIFLI